MIELSGSDSLSSSTGRAASGKCREIRMCNAVTENPKNPLFIDILSLIFVLFGCDISLFDISKSGAYNIKCYMR